MPRSGNQSKPEDICWLFFIPERNKVDQETRKILQLIFGIGDRNSPKVVLMHECRHYVQILLFISMTQTNILNMYSWLSRCGSARGLVPGYPWEVPLRLRLVYLFYSQNVPLKLKKRTLDWFCCHTLFYSTLLLHLWWVKKGM